MRKLYVSGTLVGLLFALIIGHGVRPAMRPPHVSRVVAQATITPSGTCADSGASFC